MDDEHTPRPNDHLVEPMYEALHGPEGEPGAASAPEGDPGSEGGSEPQPGRGCLGLLLLGLLGLVVAARGMAPVPGPGPEPGALAEETGQPGRPRGPGAERDERARHRVSSALGYPQGDKRARVIWDVLGRFPS